MMIFKLSFSLHFTGVFPRDPYFLLGPIIFVRGTPGFRVTPFGNGSVSGSMKFSCQKSINILVFLPVWGGGGAAQLDTRRTLPPVNTASRTSGAGARYDVFR